jgi:hypothetical protein
MILGIKVGVVVGFAVVGFKVAVAEDILIGMRERFLIGMAESFLLRGAEDGFETGRGRRVEPLAQQQQWGLLVSGSK